MYFILKNDRVKENARNWLNGVSANEDTPVMVTFKPYKKDRSAAQNRLMWLWYGILSKDQGNTPDELHELLKERLLGFEIIQINGKDYIRPKSTKKLKVSEFADYLQKIEMLACELNIVLPHPEDYRFAMGRE